MTLDDSALYTRYVRLSASERELDTETFSQVFAALQKDLMAELKRRGLIRLTPNHFGMIGQSMWVPEVQEELTQSCYVYIFVDRFHGLHDRAKSQSIEPMIRKNIQNFVHDFRKEKDPIGFKVYKIVCEAAKIAVEDGKLHTMEEDDMKKAKDKESEPLKFSMTTIFQAVSQSRQDTVEATGLQDIVASWEPQFIRKLATGFREGRSAAVDELANRLGRLGDAGIERFLLREIFVPLSEAVRALRHSDMSFEAPATRQAWDPEQRAIHHDFMDKFGNCVLGWTKATMGIDDQYLARLWGHFKREFFTDFAAGRGLESSPGFLYSDDTKVSQSKLAIVMDVSRQKLKALMEKLREIVSYCMKMMSQSG